MSSPIPNNPFARAKTRSIVSWYILAIPVLLVFWIVGAILLSPVIRSLANLPIDFEDPLFTDLAIYILFQLVTIFWLLNYRAKTKFDLKYLWGKIPDWKNYSRYILLTISILLFSLGTVQILFYFLYAFIPETIAEMLEQQLLLTADEISYPIIYNILETASIVIFAPLLEEILFRGVLLHRWGTKWSVATAIALSSLTFGCMHINPPEFIRSRRLNSE